MSIDVLLSTMFEENYEILNKCNIQTNAIIVNQCDTDCVKNIDYLNNKIKWINTKERGLSNSRNMALKNSSADICLICDNDVKYYDGYEKMVEKAFRQVPNADVIIFDIDEIGREEHRQKNNKIHRVPIFKTYSSVHIAFKRKSIISNDISFDTNFGTGSNLYSMAEDALLFRMFNKNRLKVYVYPYTISRVDFSISSWFSGFDKKYCFDVGAYLSAAYPYGKHILKWYYPRRLSNKSDLNSKEIIRYIKLGFKGYKEKKSYEQFCLGKYR